MKSKLSFFIIVLLIVFLTSIAFASRLFIPFDRSERLVGFIKRISDSSVLIWDEQDKMTKHFYYLFNDLMKFKEGDHVRIYYNVHDHVIKSMRKMTPVEYIKGKQNAGYIYRADDGPIDVLDEVKR